MIKSVRKIIFWTFLGAFFVSAPLVVLYTAGYRLNFSHLSLMKTGLLSITTEPKNAMVFLDNKNLKKSTPTIIENLMPGEHLVRLEKTGYLPWEKNLEIKEQETTFIPKAVLFLDETAQLEETGDFVTVAFNPSETDVAYVVEEEGWLEVWLKNFANGEKKLLLRLAKEEIDNLKLVWSAQGKYLLVEETTTKTKTWEIVDSRGVNRFTFEDLLTKNGWLKKDPINSVTRDPFVDEIFYVKTEKAVWLVNLLNNTANQLLNEPASVWQRGELLLFLRETDDGEELTRQEKDGTQQVVAKLAVGNYNFLPAPPTLVLLKDTNRDKIILVDDRGIDKPIHLEAEAFTAAWNPNNENQLLYVSDFELHIYDIEKQNDELITRVSTPITAAVWHPSGSDILFSDTQNISAIELDKRGLGRNVFLLAQTNILNAFTVINDSKNLFFWGQVGVENGIFKRALQK